MERPEPVLRVPLALVSRVLREQPVRLDLMVRKAKPVSKA